MNKISKRFKQLQNLVTQESYSLVEAIYLLKKLQSTKFIESVEAHIALNVNPKYTDQQLRASVTLPHGTGQKLKIAVLAEVENKTAFLEQGADIVGNEDLLTDIGQEKINFDILITTPSLMPKLTKLGKILGPKSLMPSPKAGTVVQNISEAIQEFRKGKIEYRTDKTGIIHLSFGKTTFLESNLQENLLKIYESIEKNKPASIKGKYFKTIYLCTSMSPSIRINLNTLKI